MKRLPLKIICGVAISCFSYSSIAAQVDFTDLIQLSTFKPITNGYSGTVDGIGFTLTSTGGSINFDEAYDGNGNGCQSHEGILKCDQDGVGITSDEITGAYGRSAGQSLALSFDSAVNVNRFDFLDLYVRPKESTRKEQATITLDGTFLDTVDATDEPKQGGYASLILTTPQLVQTIAFTAASGAQFRDDENNDYQENRFGFGCCRFFRRCKCC